MIHEVKVELEVNRCYECGRWWALEKGMRGQCPRCARAAVELAEEREMKAARGMATLRGALTKAKRR
jgi:Zn finger protein HypA/HybF involved in hydrogenase expression